MDYLHNYLRVIPKYDADVIRKSLGEKELNFQLDEISEQEFQRLIEQLSEEGVRQTDLPELGERINSEPLNAFYKKLSLDLNRLFSEQASIETASKNYDHIYQANLEELRRSIESLEEVVVRMEKQSRGEKGLIVKTYGFQPEKAKQMTEEWNKETSYLFVDRDGTNLGPAETNRLYHTYYLSLQKKEEDDALRDSNGNTTAQLEVLYETPGTLTNYNPSYSPSRAIDGSTDSFWFNVCLKANNGIDQVTIAPEGRD